VIALPFLAYAFLAWILRSPGSGSPASRLSGRAVWGIFAVIVTFTVLRNLPFAPFAVLAP
jgi:hypothetical protein